MVIKVGMDLCCYEFVMFVVVCELCLIYCLFVYGSILVDRFVQTEIV